MMSIDILHRQKGLWSHLCKVWGMDILSPPCGRLSWTVFSALPWEPVNCKAKGNTTRHAYMMANCGLIHFSSRLCEEEEKKGGGERRGRGRRRKKKGKKSGANFTGFFLLLAQELYAKYVFHSLLNQSLK